jgi:nucleoid-associated protein YgaU
MGSFRDDKRDARPDFSNVRSGSSSTAPAAGSIFDADTDRLYTVREGDNLSQIAEQMYGDANEWRRIYAANRDVLKDPDLIYPGQSLRIP